MTEKKNSMKKKHRIPWGIIITYIILIAISVVMIFPLYYLINISLKTTSEFFQNPTGLVMDITFDNYVQVFNEMQVINRFFTTVLLVGISCILALLIALFAAFPLSRNHFRWSGKVMGFILASMFFPGSLVANVIILKDFLGIYGTPVALVVIWVSGGIPMNVFMLIGFLKSLPRELDEASFIDGCGYFRYIITTGIPLMMPIIATLLMIKAISSWNDFLGPFIYMTDPAFKTLSTGLYTYMSQFGAQWNKFAAAIFVVALPMIIVYIFFQRFIIEGLAAGAIKG